MEGSLVEEALCKKGLPGGFPDGSFLEEGPFKEGSLKAP